MAGTTAAALKAALKTAMIAEAGLSGVPVSYGEPGDTARTEHIWIGAATAGDSDLVAFKSGRTRRDESYTVDVVVDVSSMDSAETSEARAVVLVTVIEEMLADDPKLNDVPNLLWCIVESWDLSTQEGAQGPRSVMRLTLKARGRLL
jgi:hypothetical protein